MVSLHLGTQHLERHCRQAPETSQSSSTRKSQKINMIRIIASNKQLLDETKSNIRFVLPGQVMLGEAKCDSFFHSVWNEILFRTMCFTYTECIWNFDSFLAN